MSLGNFKEIFEFYNNGKSYTSKEYDNVILHLSSDSVLEMDYLDDLYPEASSFIFLSKHKSDSAIPTLTCHSVGNFLDNPYGGNPKELGIAYPSLQKEYIKKLDLNKKLVPAYDIIIEATHHGPTSLKKPTIFIELGSSEPQWFDRIAASTVCSCLLKVIQNGLSKCKQVGICLGGTHYPTKFNKLLLSTNFGLGAIASKHNLDGIDEGMLQQMVSKSAEPVSHVILDSKGLGAHRDRILRLVQESGLEILMI